MPSAKVRLFCPGCGRFMVKVEGAVSLQMTCTNCHQDVEFARRPIEPEKVGGRVLAPRMIVWFPDDASKNPHSRPI